MKKINPLTAFANPASKTQNPALNPRPRADKQLVDSETLKAKKLLAKAMKKCNGK